MIGIERNKDPELTPKQRNTSYFVILDDRKHGRSGKFPVFYDTDTGDYLEPPEGFLDSAYETLREWYAAHPEDDPSHASYKPTHRDASVPLSEENQEKGYADLQEGDIPSEEPTGPSEDVVQDVVEKPVDLPDDPPASEDSSDWDEAPF